MSKVKPVSSAVRILQFLARTNGPKSSAEIARALELNPSTCFNILRTLAAEEMLFFDDRSKSYSTGLGTVKAVEKVISREGRIPFFRRPLSSLAEVHNVTASLWKRHTPSSNVMIWATEGLADVQIRLRAGSHLPRYIGAFGRLVANSDGVSRGDLRDQFKSLRWATKLSFETYLAQVRDVAELGYAIDDGYFAAGITALATPVHDLEGRLKEGIVISMFKDQYDAAGIREIVGEMKSVAADSLADEGRAVT